MKYLITGGAGFIGSHLTDRLLADGHNVVVLDNFIAGKEENLSRNKNNSSLKVLRQSIVEDLTEVFSEGSFAAVFHLAALPRVQFGIDYPLEAHNANINGTLNLLSACRQFGIKRFIFSSSSSIYGAQKTLPLVETMFPQPIHPYALQKLTSEYYGKIFYNLYGLEVIGLRYFSVYGPRQNPQGPYGQAVPKLIKHALDEEAPVITGDGKQTRDFTYVSDVVEANILAAGTKNKKCFGEIFNIGAGHGFSINELAQQVAKLANIKIKPVYVSPRVEARDTLADVTKAKKLLGWEPKVKFGEGLKLTYDYFSKIN